MNERSESPKRSEGERKYTLDDVKRAFEAARETEELKGYGVNGPYVFRDYIFREFGNYAATLDQPKSEPLPEALYLHAGEAPYMHGDWQREHDRLILQEVDGRIEERCGIYEKWILRKIGEAARESYMPKSCVDGAFDPNVFGRRLEGEG